jgi:hypothetical protein
MHCTSTEYAFAQIISHPYFPEQNEMQGLRQLAETEAKLKKEDEMLMPMAARSTRDQESTGCLMVFSSIDTGVAIGSDDELPEGGSSGDEEDEDKDVGTANKPKAGEGAFIGYKRLTMGCVRALIEKGGLAHEDWIGRVIGAADLIATRFTTETGKRWYVGDKLQTGMSLGNEFGFQAEYNDGTQHCHTDLKLREYGTGWFLLAQE